MYAAIDKNKNIHIDSEGRLLDWRLRRIIPEADQAGYLFFFLPSPAGPEKRYVHVEVARHHGDPIARASGPRQISPDQVTFKDGDKTNTSVSNLVYDPQTKADQVLKRADAVLEETGDLTWEQVEALKEPAEKSAGHLVETSEYSFDFTVIDGIGATINTRLHENGIMNVAEFVAADPLDLGPKIKMLPAKLGKLQERVAAEFQ